MGSDRNTICGNNRFETGTKCEDQTSYPIWHPIAKPFAAFYLHCCFVFDFTLKVWLCVCVSVSPSLYSFLFFFLCYHRHYRFVISENCSSVSWNQNVSLKFDSFSWTWIAFGDTGCRIRGHNKDIVALNNSMCVCACVCVIFNELRKLYLAIIRMKSAQALLIGRDFQVIHTDVHTFSSIRFTQTHLMKWHK